MAELEKKFSLYNGDGTESLVIKGSENGIEEINSLNLVDKIAREQSKCYFLKCSRCNPSLDTFDLLNDYILKTYKTGDIIFIETNLWDNSDTPFDGSGNFEIVAEVFAGYYVMYTAYSSSVSPYKWHKYVSSSYSVDNNKYTVGDREWTAGGVEYPLDANNVNIADTGNNFTSENVEGALTELSTQFKDIANKTVIEDNKLYLVKSDGTKLDEGTDLPTSSGTDMSNNIETYKCEDIGELYLAPSDYTAWCPGNLRFDTTLDKYVTLIFSANGHPYTTAYSYISYIDKDSFVASKPVKCKFVDSDGSTDITPTKDSASTAFIILDDGTYMMTHDLDGTTYRFTSSDNGLTWVKNEIVVGFSGTAWGMTKLSNGRLICGDDLSKVGIYYSDDKGVNWTQVIPATCGGGYEAEACILELFENNLIAIARYSMSGKGYYESGDSEHAIISYSTDNGTTWAPWQISNSIDNMNASSCTGLVHDGIVEVFATSRWYSNGTNVNTDNANTGKNGAMIHYVATIENALNDNFSKVGIIDYAKGKGGEYHSPCVTKDSDNNILIMHMDGGSITTCNNRFVRGSLNHLNYVASNNSKSPVKAYTAKYVETLVEGLTTEILALKLALSNIAGSGVEKPSGSLIRTKHWNADDNITKTIFPYIKGSDFADVFKCGSTANSAFKTDSNNNNYAHMYACSCGVTRSDTATDFKLSLQWSHGYTYFVVIKDGYVTAVSVRSGVTVFDDNNKATSVSNISSTIEVFDGGCIVDGKEYELTKSTVEEFASNIAGINKGAYISAYANAINNTIAGNVSDLTTLDYNKTYIGFYAQQYQDYYDIGYWEKY